MNKDKTVRSLSSEWRVSVGSSQHVVNCAVPTHNAIPTPGPSIYSASGGTTGASPAPQPAPPNNYQSVGSNGSYRSYNPSPAPQPNNPTTNGSNGTFQPITNPGGTVTGHIVYGGGGSSGLPGIVVGGGAGQPGTVASSTGNGLVWTSTIHAPPPTIKDDITYIVVRLDGTCMEHMLDSPITPREMIGMCMFINAAQMSIQGQVEFDWENLIATLQLERHFIEGHDDHTLYEEDTNVAYIKLFS